LRIADRLGLYAGRLTLPFSRGKLLFDRFLQQLRRLSKRRYRDRKQTQKSHPGSLSAGINEPLDSPH
jgi:hypothetical protein